MVSDQLYRGVSSSRVFVRPAILALPMLALSKNAKRYSMTSWQLVSTGSGLGGRTYPWDEDDVQAPDEVAFLQDGKEDQRTPSGWQGKKGLCFNARWPHAPRCSYSRQGARGSERRRARWELG